MGSLGSALFCSVCFPDKSPSISAFNWVKTIEEVIAELISSTSSEREHRLIDSDQPASMEEKKRSGYF